MMFSCITTISNVSVKADEAAKKNDFINLMNKYSIKRCFYGHIHNSYTDVVEGEIKGVNLKLISADYLDFKLYNI